MTADQRRRVRHLEAARGYLFLDMPDHALRELREIRDSRECVYEANCLRGEALRQKKEFETALEAFQEADRAHPDSLDVLIGMAWCQKRIDQLSEAIATMEHAYAVAPDVPIVLYNLSCYHALAGDKSSALSYLGRALRMDGSLRRLIPDEHDFDALRHDPHFQLIANPDEYATA